MTMRVVIATLAVVGLFGLGWTSRAAAHCDALDGPVVTAARRALETGDVNPALAWVPASDEAEIRRAFERARSVRRLGAEARQLADTWFFETLVRVHRAGEGAPFTGLAPAGRDVGPAIPLADRALADGELEPLIRLVAERSRDGLVQRFERARSARQHPVADVAAGREFVRRYVDFIHYADGVWRAAAGAGDAHAEPEAAPAGHAH
jgi:hypothetical protein